ncbi:MAG: methionyl-tRNA formyltransferase [Candidatus Riflebacteria bacterium]|nr:methionyl-tRNA formyltransferase [Candidatus Riflebacteria bacterium]
MKRSDFPLKVVFMGSPRFAVLSLEKLLTNSDFEVRAVYCMPDKPQGRGKKMEMTPVKQLSLERGIPVNTPTSFLRVPEEINKLKAYDPDLLVVVAYGLILPQSALKIPKLSSINLHGSILPRYRGPSPIHAALMNGDSETGNTVMLMNEKMDEGDILAVEKYAIPNEFSFNQLHDLMSASGAELLSRTLLDFASGNIVPTPQDHSRASYTSKVTTETAKIDFQNSANAIERLIRAMNPSPGAWFLCGGERIKIGKARTATLNGNFPPTTVINADPLKGLSIVCGNKTILEPLALQRPGKQMIPVADFLRGFSFQGKLIS